MAQRITWFTLLGAVGLASALSCSPASSPTSAQPSPGAAASPGAGASAAPATGGDAAPRALSFASDVQPVLRQHCMGCHTEGRGGANAVTMYNAAGEVQHANIKASIGQMIQAIEAGRMPMGRPGTVPAADVQKLKDWQAAGAPNN